MRVGVDLDGVVYNFVDAFRTYLDQPDLPEPTQWDFWRDWDMSFDYWRNAFAAGVEAGVVFGPAPPLAGALQGLRSLRKAGHTIHIVTDRPHPRAVELTDKWLRAERIPYDTLTFSADKTLVLVHAYIDDRVENVEAVQRMDNPWFDYDEPYAPHPLVVLMDRPWNQHRQDLPRVTSWRQFVRMVKAHG